MLHKSVIRLRSALIAGALTVCASAQTPADLPALTILSPEPEAYVSGLTLLRARVDPLLAASTVSFFVDGRQLCVVSQVPFDCEWEAGRSVIEHQVRVVATLATGGRLVQTVRTKGIGYAENVDVEVVQVTVTVTDNQGRFVRGLPPSAFHVFEEGRPQKLSHFDAENLPLELIVAVEVPRVAGRQWFRKVGTRAAQAISKVVVAAVRAPSPRIAAGSIAPTVVRLGATERRQLCEALRSIAELTAE